MSHTNAYGRKDRERKRLYTNACGKERQKEQAKNACGKEKKTKRKLAALIKQANEKWLP